jgi:hypothetical protein
MLSEENFDTELLENFLKLSKNSKNFNKELKKVKQKEKCHRSLNYLNHML